MLVVAASCCRDASHLHGLGILSELKEDWMENKMENDLQCQVLKSSLLRNCGICVYKHQPANLNNLKQITQGQCGKFTPTLCAKLVHLYSKRIKSVITEKKMDVRNNKVWGLNTYTIKLFVFFIKIFPNINSMSSKND